MQSSISDTVIIGNDGKPFLYYPVSMECVHFVFKLICCNVKSGSVLNTVYFAASSAQSVLQRKIFLKKTCPPNFIHFKVQSGFYCSLEIRSSNAFCQIISLFVLSAVAVDTIGVGHLGDVPFQQSLAPCIWSLFICQRSQGTQSMPKR